MATSQNNDMITNPYLSVIIPAFNEARRIPPTLEAVYTYLTKQSFSWELLFVLDGSQDNTLAVLEQFAREKGENNNGVIRILSRGENRGKGFTIRQGMLEARGKVRLFTDADNSTDISHFDKMRPLFEQGYDVVIASRNHRDAEGARQAEPQPLIKRFFGNLGNLFIQLVAVWGIWDTQCGFKAFSAESAQRIFSLATIDRWGIDIEALALARHYRYRIGIVAAYWIDNPDTHVKSTDYLKTLGEALQVRWQLWTGKYSPSGT